MSQPATNRKSSKDDCTVLTSSSSLPPPRNQVLSRLCPDFRPDSLALHWKEFVGDNLRVGYTHLFGKSVADVLFRTLEQEIEYYEGDLTRVKVFGKWHRLPRKQVAYGDPGLTYTFSGTCIPAKPWLPLLSDLRILLNSLTGHDFNFVLINRYKDGLDHIGEHRDAEKDLDPCAPIASLSLGQQRDFVLRHATSRKRKRGDTRPADPGRSSVTIPLEHGSLLLMKPPTNVYWYHSLPIRSRCPGPRINLTFRRMII